MHEFKVKFYLRPEPEGEDAPRTVQARIYLDHVRDYLTSTRVSVPAASWNARTEKVTLGTSEGRLMNLRLENLRRQITDIYLRHEHDQDLSVALIKQKWLEEVASMPDRQGVCAFFMQYIKENGEALGQDRLLRLTQIATLFGKYLSYAYNVKDVDFTDIDHRMLHDFEAYLLVEEGYTHARTLKNKVSALKSLLGAARELGMTKEDIFEGYSSNGLHPVKAEFLTIEEVRRLKKAVFTTARLEKVRDCFLFSCYTGLSYQEVKSLTRDRLTRLNGSTWILLEGDMPRYIPLLPYPAAVIGKYTSDECTTMLPVISHQKMNLYLKEIAEQCGIDKRLTFQLAVRTFMNIALKAGASTDSVSHMLGRPLHPAETMARFSPERIEEEMALFAARMGRDRPDT